MTPADIVLTLHAIPHTNRVNLLKIILRSLAGSIGSGGQRSLIEAAGNIFADTRPGGEGGRGKTIIVRIEIELLKKNVSENRNKPFLV